MELSIVNICFFSDGLKLVKDRTSEIPMFSLRVFQNNKWEIINQWSDPGHVANLLVKSGYASEYLLAITLLNIL